MSDEGPGPRFAAAVDAERKMQGRTWVWLKKQTGVARTTVTRWRNQETAPTAGPVIAIADALGMDRAEALRLANVLPDVTIASEGEPVPLAKVETDVLLAEVRRRIPPQT